MLRDVIGVVVIVVVTRVWRMKHFDATVELGSAVTNRFTAALVLVVVVPGAALVFALIARRGLRLRAWSLSAIPVFAVLSTVAVAVGPSLFARTAAGQTVAYWISMGVNALMTRSGPFALVIALVLGALTAFVGLVMVTGLVAGVVMSVGSSFRAGDAHPLMASVVAIGLAICTVSLGVWQRLSGADPTLPLWVAWTLTIGGPIVVVALSVWQIVRLRALGLRFREPHWRVAGDPISRGVHRALCGAAALTNRMASRTKA